MSDQGLQDFDAFWHLDLDVVEKGNYDRGGWSTVCRFHHDGRAFYIKRQSNHLRYSLQAFPFKEPTLKMEFDKISRYHKHGIPCVEVVYFGWRKSQGEQQAILVTEALDDYLPLNEFLASEDNPSICNRRRQVCEFIGKAVARLHSAGIEHYNLYPQHIFVSRDLTRDFSQKMAMNNVDPPIRFIDLESSRANFGLKSRKLRDLETLSRRMVRLSRADKLRVFLAYSGQNKVDKKLRAEINTITKRTRTKLERERPWE